MNRMRGESLLNIQGKHYVLCLTLGALAEIQDGLGLEDLSHIGPRLQHLRAGDLAILSSALIRGGGGDLSPADVLKLACPLTQLLEAISACFENAGLQLDGPVTEAEDPAPFPGRG